MGAAASSAKQAAKAATSYTSSTSKKGAELPPMWIYTAQVTGDTSQDCFGAVSPGFHQMGPNSVTRNRVAMNDMDGVLWKKGFTDGKHVFEIVYPQKERGYFATVGVATIDAPLTQRGKCCLCGGNPQSWGVCLHAKRAYHKNSAVKKYPSTMANFPDKFYMYLDVDSGSISFGSDLDFYGTAHVGIRPGKPLHPMVCSCMPKSTITMVYRGQGDPNRIPNIAMTPAGPPLQQPAPRQDPPALESAPAHNAPPPYTAKDPNNGPTDGTESKMTDAGPPPPPPTKMGDQGNEREGSNLSLPKKEVAPIPEETVVAKEP